MFNKLKQFKDLRGQAKNMQNMLAQEKVTVEKGGILLTMDGNQKILELKINRELSAEKIESVMSDVFEDCIKKIQRKMAEVMQKSGGLANLGM